MHVVLYLRNISLLQSTTEESMKSRISRFVIYCSNLQHVTKEHIDNIIANISVKEKDQQMFQYITVQKSLLESLQMQFLDFKPLKMAKYAKLH